MRLSTARLGPDGRALVSRNSKKISLDEELVERAFALAYFIHPDRETALAITAAALFFLDQRISDRRRRYGAKPRHYRTKIRRGRAQLLQDLVCGVAISGDYCPRGWPRTDDDRLIRFLVHLVRITTRRNSFYVNLGISRILYDYSTADTIAIQDVLIQDPERMRADAYFRYAKGVLLSEMHHPFGSRLRTVAIARGELSLCSTRPEPRVADLVDETLRRLVPWQTHCALPEDLDPRADEVPALRFRGQDPDDEHPIELSRMHTILCPRCYERLLTSLGLGPPRQRLRIPRFFGATETADAACRQIRDRRAPPALGVEGRARVEAELEAIRQRQKRWSLEAIGAR